MAVTIALIALSATLLGLVVTLTIWHRQDTARYVAAVEDRFALQLTNAQLTLEITELKQNAAQLASKIAAFESQQAEIEARNALQAQGTVLHGSPHDVSVALGELHATPLPGSTAPTRARSLTAAIVPPADITSPF